MIHSGVLGVDVATRPLNPRDTTDILLMSRDSLVYGAFHVRYQHLLVNKMEILDGSKSSSEFTKKVLKLYWLPFLSELAFNYFQFGFCPYTYIQKTVYVSDEDRVRERRYGDVLDPEMKMVVVDVPIVPDRSLIQVIRMMKGYEEIYIVEDNEGNIRPDVHVVHSKLYRKPDWTTGRYNSECGVLLEDWRRIRRAEKLQEQVELMNALPPIMLQRTVRTDMQAFTELQAAHVATLHNVGLTPNGFIELTDGEMAGRNQVSQSQELNALHNRIYYGDGFVNRSDLTHRIPDGFQVAPNTAEARLITNTSELRKEFAQRISLVTRVPEPYIHSDGQNRPMIESSATVDNERNRLIDQVSILAEDYAMALYEVWVRLYGDDDRQVRFHIPVPSTVDTKSVLELYEYGALPDQVAIQQLLNIYKIDSKQVEQHVNLKTHKLKRFRPSVEETLQSKQTNKKKKKKTEK